MHRSPVALLSAATLGRGGHVVLEDVDLRIDRGELVGVIGASGAGKSTLLAALAGEPVLMAGKADVTAHGDTSHPVGLVPQLADDRWTPLCVEEIVALGAPRNGLRTTGGERRQVAELLVTLGLSDFAARRLGELSGGQRQRVAIARALMSSRSLLLCDEPTSGADPVLAQEIVDVLRNVATQGSAVLIATHDLGIVVPGVDRVIGVNNHRIVYDGTPAGLDRQALQQVYGPGVGR